MLKSGVVGGARRRQGQRPINLTNAVEGQIAELCHDLAVETKRMRQLEEQANELRIVIRELAGPDSEREPANRAGRR